MIGKGSINHNCRKFNAENTVPGRSHLNIEYCCENVKEVYHELFDDAVERYNTKQKRKDRCIDNYYEKIRSGKQEKVFHEIILQIGNKDDCGSDTENGEMAAKILDEYMKDFQRRNPTLRVFAAHLHMDEATPHLHIDFVPYITASKRGVDTRVSLKQALYKLGFKGGSKSETELDQWINFEKEQLALVMERYGIEWEKKGTHKEHLSVLDYKKQERAREVSELNKQIEQLTNKKDDTEKQLQEMAALVENVQEVAGEYVGEIEEVLPEAGRLESGKGYREHKMIPFIKKLIDIVKTFYVEYYNLQCRFKELKRDYDSLEYRNIGLVRENKELKEKIGELEEVKKEYGKVRKFFGVEQVEEVLKEMREKERLKVEAEKEKRRGRKNNRGAR